MVSDVSVSLQGSTKAVRRTSKSGSRTYTIDGVEYPSVTTILQVVAKPALIGWSRKVALEKVRHTLLDEMKTGETLAGITSGWIDTMLEAARKRPDEERDQAADFGLRSHELIGSVLGGEETIVPEDLLPVMEGFDAWQGKSGLDITATEQVVCSKLHAFAGTFDAVATRGGGEGVYVIDFKTSNGIYDEMSFQVAAYAQAYKEQTGQEVLGGYVVRFGKKKPEFEAREVDLEEGLRGFLGALGLWRTLRKKQIWR